MRSHKNNLLSAWFYSLENAFTFMTQLYTRAHCWYKVSMNRVTPALQMILKLQYLQIIDDRVNVREDYRLLGVRFQFSMQRVSIFKYI